MLSSNYVGQSGFMKCSFWESKFRACLDPGCPCILGALSFFGSIMQTGKQIQGPGRV